jgi:hypothetical protein
VGGANLSSSSSTAMQIGRELMLAGLFDPTKLSVMVVNCISRILKSSLSQGNRSRTGLHFSKIGVSRVSLYAPSQIRVRHNQQTPALDR